MLNLNLMKKAYQEIKFKLFLYLNMNLLILQLKPEEGPIAKHVVFMFVPIGCLLIG